MVSKLLKEAGKKQSSLTKESPSPDSQQGLSLIAIKQH